MIKITRPRRDITFAIDAKGCLITWDDPELDSPMYTRITGEDICLIHYSLLSEQRAQAEKGPDLESSWRDYERMFKPRGTDLEGKL